MKRYLVAFLTLIYFFLGGIARSQLHALSSFLIYKNDTVNKVFNDTIKFGKWIVFDGKHVAEDGWYNHRGKKIGEWRTYYRNGVTRSTAYFERGELYGIAITYDSTGRMLERGFYDHNRWVGNYDLFYHDGNIQHRFTYGSDGKRMGFSYYYWKNGFICIVGFFNEGVELGSVGYDSLGRKQYEVRFDSLHQMYCISAVNAVGRRISDTIFSDKRKRILLISEDSNGKKKLEILYDSTGVTARREGNLDSIGMAIGNRFTYFNNPNLFNSLDTLVKEENGIVLQRQNLFASLVLVEKQKKRMIISIGAVIMLLLVAGFFINSSRARKKSNEILSKKNNEIQEQKALVEEKNKDILDSITYAKRLQDAILPPLSLIKQYLPESFLLYKPKDIVAGDFYWMERSGDNILIAAADCTGHGVPGAMVSVVCSNALNRTVKEFKITEPGKILDKVRELVLETFEKSEDNVQDGMDISLASLTPSKGGITLSWAGAYNSLWYMENGEMKELTADKQPIGKTDSPKAFTTHTLEIPLMGGQRGAGTMLYLFTDGYADQFGGPKGKKFKYKQLQELLLANAGKSMDEQKKILEVTLNEWKGSLEQVDDILVIGIRA